jgi:hypothetical protein
MTRRMRSHLSHLAPLGLVFLALGAAPLSADVLYSNGPISGSIGAYTVDGDHNVTNSFVLTSASTITDIIFGAWTYTGRTGLWADWAITAAPFGTPIASGEATLTNLFLYANSSNADVSQESFSIPALTLDAGTYWLELDDTMTTASRWFWWDQSNGPSQAQSRSASGIKSIGSESFQVLGTSSAAGTVPEPGSLALCSGALAFAAALVGKRRLRSRGQRSLAR